jgi:hypothetical protein
MIIFEKIIKTVWWQYTRIIIAKSILKDLVAEIYIDPVIF